MSTFQLVGPAVSIVAPCFNEEDGITELHRRVTSAAKKAVGDDYEIVLIDDGSSDETWLRLSALSAADSHVVAVKLSRNHGHQIALTAGLSVVSGRTVFVIDADLQDPPELLAPMLEVMEAEGADVVYGQRRTRAGETRLKRYTANAFYRMLARSTEIDIPVDTGDFRLMTRRVSDLLVNMPERDRFVRGMVSWLGFKQVAFQYDRDARFTGQTKYPVAKMIRFATDAFLGYSMILLRIAAFLAFILLVALVFAGIHSLYAWAFLDTAPGWTSTTILITVVGAFQLFVLSILGEYIGRIYLEVKRRPLYVIDTIKRFQ